MLEYHLQHDWFINDKTYFKTILYGKILYNFFVLLANTWKVFKINPQITGNKIKI